MKNLNLEAVANTAGISKQVAARYAAILGASEDTYKNGTDALNVVIQQIKDKTLVYTENKKIHNFIADENGVITNTNTILLTYSYVLKNSNQPLKIIAVLQRDLEAGKIYNLDQLPMWIVEGFDNEGAYRLQNIKNEKEKEKAAIDIAASKSAYNTKRLERIFSNKKEVVCVVRDRIEKEEPTNKGEWAFTDYLLFGLGCVAGGAIAGAASYIVYDYLTGGEREDTIIILDEGNGEW